MKQKINIAIITRLLINNKLEGIGTFTHEVLRRMVKNHPEVQFYFIFDREYSEDFIYAENVIPIVVGPKSRTPLSWSYWLEVAVPKLLKKHSIDLLISTDGYIPLKDKTKSISIIHDINFHHFPKFIPIHYRFYLTHFFPKFAKKANRIFTISNYSKSDIAKSYHISKDKIDVEHNGVDEFFKSSSKNEILNTKEKYTNKQDFFLILGALNPRKNIESQLIAFDRYKKKTNTKLKLLIVGEKMWWTKKSKKLLTSLESNKDIIFSGFLHKSEIKQIYGSAKALLFASYFEGFGMPIIEAMKCACPVITSNCTSMPEVAGDCALLVDPYNIDSITDAMIQLNNDDVLRNKLIEKGLNHSRKFTWEASTNALWQSIEKVLSKC